MRAALSAALFACMLQPAAADPVVVELFTSQGCSACPPADEMLGELAGRDDVIALSLHVDYWDWIGWADTFAKPAYVDRQRAYAAAAGSSVVYTPHFVVGGMDQVAGPSGMTLAELVMKHAGRTHDVLRPAPGEGREVTAGPSDKDGVLILVTYRPTSSVHILQGENAGHDMTYHNIVESWTILQDWDGSETTVAVPEPEDGLVQAVLAQEVVDGKPGPIVGAIRLD
ncbi:DUF1223 domain-containing protein [uncultured Jannaschia sp.]|uniref:DUF1223 domain-containing protein n=1 Tax=uncultured Jannaschia sp. TaxID=293347 RepID=UPI002634C67A|nr:DUF1223 domain-containing protein [uncultured Jannaschia sp.]